MFSKVVNRFPVSVTPRSISSIRPLADAVGLPGGEGEHLHCCGAAVPVLGVDAVADVGEHLFETGLARLDDRICHPDDGRVAIVDGAGVAGGRLAHGRGGFPGVEPADQDPLANEIGAAAGRSLVVVFEAAAQAGEGGAVDDVEMLLAEPLPQHHDLLHARVFVNEIGLGEVTEGLVDETRRRVSDRG